jgi:glycosyltransferase 2 family protein
VGDRRIRLLQWLLGLTIVGFAARSLVRNWGDLRAQPLEWRVEPGWIILSAVLVWLMYAILIAAWRRMLAAWGWGGLDLWSASRIWTVSNLGKYLPGKIWAVAGMAVMAQRAGVGAGPATGSAVILQVLAIGTGAAIAGLTGWGALRTAYPGAGVGLVALVLGAAAAIGLLFWPELVSRVVRRAVPDAPPMRPPRGAVAFGLVANALAWVGYGAALWLLARGLLPGAGLELLPAIAVFTASYLAGFLALFAPGGIGVREGVFILMLQGPIGIGAATALAIASRLLLTVTELGAAVPFLLFPRGRPRVAG